MQMVLEVIEDAAVEPRPYQQRIVSKVVAMYLGKHVHEQTGEHESAVQSVMLESPTGSGKTIMALLIAKAMQTIDPDLVIGWVAMRANLLTQAARENRAMGINADIQWISMFNKDPREILEARANGKRILLIVDECQHDSASSMAHLHNIISPDMILGMTATPFRSDRMKLCFQKIVKDCGIHQLIQDKYLSEYHQYTIPNWVPEQVADHFCADPDRWGKSIFFMKNLEECYELYALLRVRGINAEVVKGGQQKITDQQLDRFERDEFQCLINCMVLTEGFDCPSLKTAWIRDSSKGPTIQMGGRAFRKHPELPVKQIVQSEHTKWPMIRTAMPSQQFLWVRDGWKSLKVNPHLELINNNSRMAIAVTETHFPQFLADRSKKRPPRF